MSGAEDSRERTLPPNYPAGWVERYTLPSGREVTLRPIRPDDALRLQAGFRRLSPQSIYLRFMGPRNALTDEQAAAFANVDYQTHMAFVAVREVLDNELLIGVARYGLPDPADPSVAEIAIVVGDAYQGQGLGLRLLDLLVRYARAQGVTTLLATVLSANDRIQTFIERSDFRVERTLLEPGVWEVRMNVDGEG